MDNNTFTVSTVFSGLKAAENFARFFSDDKRVMIYRRALEEIRSGMERFLYDREEGDF